MTDLGRRIDAAQERWERRTGKPFPWHTFFGDQVALHIELRDPRGRHLRTCPAIPRQRVQNDGNRTMHIASIVMVWSDGRESVDPQLIGLCPGDTLDLTYGIDFVVEREGPWGTPVREKVGCATHPTA